MSETSGPLSGITVVSLEQAVAAPFASRQLGDLGARVIKIERPDGDFARDYDTSVNGMSSYFVWINRNKESIRLDLKTPADKALLSTMLESADVFIQNLAPGAVERLGFGSDAVFAINPQIIYTSISGYGRGGPYSDKKAYDLLVACETGLVSITGTADEPVRVGISIADIATGMYAYSGILAALLRRQQTNRGELVELSLLDALGEWMGQPYLYSQYGGTAPQRSGADHATIAPYGPAATRDGMVYFSVQSPREWVRFCREVLQDPELSGDPRFATNDLRVINRKALSAIVNASFGSLPTVEAVGRLDAAGIANAELRTIDGFANHPQLEHRDRWAEVDTPVGPVRVLKPPFTFSSFALRMDEVPALGAHDESLREEFSSPLSAASSPLVHEAP